MGKGLTTNEHEGSFGGYGNTVKLDCGDGCSINLLKIMNCTLTIGEFYGV